jgi:hypothetical protein
VFVVELIMPESLPSWKERGYIDSADAIVCDKCKLEYSKEHYKILFENKKLGYFLFPHPEDAPAIDLLCHDCLFKNLKKYTKGKVVDLLILDEESEYNCKFYPEDVDPEWNDDSDDFPFK